MLLFFLFALIFCGKINEYDVEYSTTIHKSETFLDVNEGANPKVYVDKNKVGLFTFDVEQDFREHEIISASLKLKATKIYGQEKISICFLKEPEYEAGTGSLYGMKDQVFPGEPDGATYNTIDGETGWNFNMLVKCKYSYREELPMHQYKKKIVFDVTKQLKDFAKHYTDEYKSPEFVTFALMIHSKLGMFQVESDDATLTVETLDKNELFKNRFTEVSEFFIYMEESDLAILDADPAAEEYVPCNVFYDGYMQERAGCRYKGGHSTLIECCEADGPLMEDRCRKLSFKIDTYEFRNDKDENGDKYFPKAERKRKIFNQKKINFLSMEPVVKLPYFSLDGTDLPPWIQWYDQVSINVGIALMHMSEVNIALSKYAKLYVNNEYWGLFAMVEQTDDYFTEDRYEYDDNDGEGQLWKEIGFSNPSEDHFIDRLEEGDDDMTWIVDTMTELNSLNYTTEYAKQFVMDNFNVDNALRMLAYTDLVGNFDGFHDMKCTGPVGIGCPPEGYINSNYYLYRKEIDGNSILELIGHDVDNVGAGFYHLKVRPWYDEGFEPEVCEMGEVARTINDFVSLFNLPAQCNPFFQVLKYHFMDEYKRIFYYLADNVINPTNIRELIEEYADSIDRYVFDEPTGVPSFREWERALYYFYQRMLILRQEAIDRTDLL